MMSGNWGFISVIIILIILFVYVQIYIFSLIIAHKERPMFSSETPDTHWVLFYNVYIDPVHPQTAHRIMEEQISQIGDSFMASNPEKPIVLYYNTIGVELNHTSMKEMCWIKNKIHCIFLEHFDKAYEEVTLSRVKDFCSTHPDRLVTYMHNKGSLHEKEGANTYWRRSLTMAVTSLHCLNPPNPSCNVCGLLFNMVPLVHAPGNFWTANCSYINKLLPPKSYNIKVEAVHQQMMHLRKQGKITIDIYGSNQMPWRFGIGRYTNEMWIGSHPDIIPCDLSVSPNINFWRVENKTLDEMIWSLAPRFNVLDALDNVDPPPIASAIRNASLREREYSLLPGMLFRWHRLYRKMPPHDSFVWNVFPEGDEWLERVKHSGNSVISEFLTS